MSDITVTINPPQTTSITVAGGVLPHNLTHSPAGADSLSAWYASAGDLAYVSGQIGAPAGVVLVTGNQDVSGVKNFYSRPTVNGSGVMLSGEIAGTGYLTGYVQTSQTGSFVTSGNTGNFVTSTQTGQLTGVFYPYSANPAAYVQGAVVRPSNTGNFADLGSAQTISGQKTFTKTIVAPTGFFGVNNTTGNFNGQTIAGGAYNNVGGNYSSILGGDHNTASGNYSSTIGGQSNSISGENSVLCGGYSNTIESSDSSSVVGGQTNGCLESTGIFIGGGFGNFIDSSHFSSLIGGASNLISGGLYNMAFGNSNQIYNSESCIAVGFNNTISQSTGVFTVGPQNNIAGVENSIVLSSLSSTSSGSNTAVISFDSGIYLNGPTHFDNRPQVSGIGLQTTGEYAEFNLWDEFSGALYPYPKNALNRSYNILKRAENNSGPSGETIWFNLPQWTGAKPVGTGISSFYNTGFWARDYDWSCVSFEGARTVSGVPSSCVTLISPRHALGIKHAQPSSGDKVAFISNVETGYTWEATIASAYVLSGDAMLYTFTSDAPSQIRPAAIIGSSPTSAWGLTSLTYTRALTVKNSTVLFDYFGAITSGAGFQSGSLIIEHVPEPSARYTGAHIGGDSSSPVFIPLDDGRLVYVGGASTASSVAFVGDPAIRSGIGFATSGYSVDTWNVPETQVSGIFPVSGQLSRIGGPTNKWSTVYSENIHANNLYGDLGEYEIYPYNEYLYGGTTTINPTDYHGLTNNTDGDGVANTINFSGTYPDTFWTRFVIPNSGASINFSSSGPELLMPNGSGFSGVGYVIEARGVGNNKLLIQPISAPSGAYGGGTTGYLTGYVNKSETGNFYPRSNPSGYITGVDLSPYSTIASTTGISGYLQTQITTNNQTGSFLTTGAGDARYYPLNNPSGYITGVDLSSYATTASVTGISGYQSGLINSLQSATGNLNTRVTSIEGVTGTFALAANTGAFLTTGAADTRYINATGDVLNGNLEVTGYTSGQSFVLKNGGYLDFQTGTPIWKEGRVFYDTDSKTLSYYNDEPDMTLNIGQENIIRISNAETGTILNGHVVYVSGAQGNRPKGYLASATSGSSSWNKTIGLATHDIETQGYVTTFGVVNGLNTTGYTEGDQLYLSSTPGLYSSEILQSPNHRIRIGTVLRSHQTQGSIFVAVDYGHYLETLHDVKSGAYLNNQVLRYNQPSGYWEAQDLNTGNFLTTSGNAANLTGFPTFNQNTTGYASALKLSTTTIIVSGASAPVSGQVLTATSDSAANWQTPSAGAGGGGIVLQAAQTVDTTNRSTASNSYVASGLECVLVSNLKDTGSKVRIRINCVVGAANACLPMFTLYSWDGSTATDLTPSGSNCMTATFIESGSRCTVISFEFVHSPASTTPLTYRLYMKSDGASTIIYIGQRGNDNFVDAPNIMTLEELD